METRLLESFSGYVQTWVQLQYMTIDTRPSDQQCQDFRGFPVAQRIFQFILVCAVDGDSCLVGFFLREATSENIRQLLQPDSLTRETARHAESIYAGHPMQTPSLQSDHCLARNVQQSRCSPCRQIVDIVVPEKHGSTEHIGNPEVLGSIHGVLAKP